MEKAKGCASQLAVHWFTWGGTTRPGPHTLGSLSPPSLSPCTPLIPTATRFRPLPCCVLSWCSLPPFPQGNWPVVQERALEECRNYCFPLYCSLGYPECLEQCLAHIWHTSNKYLLNKWRNDGDPSRNGQEDIFAMLVLLYDCDTFLGKEHFHLQAATWFLTYIFCYRLNVASPQNSPIENKCSVCWMVLGGGAFGRCFSYEGGALKNEISALIRVTSEIPCLFHHVRTPWEVCNLAEGPHRTMLTPWQLRLPTSRSVRNQFLFFTSHPVYVVSL